MIYKIFIALAVLLLLAGIGAAAFYTSVFSFMPRQDAVQAIPQGAGAAADAPVGAGAKRYYNQPHHFALEYPESLEASEYPGQGSSLTVAFRDPATGKGFQVFAVPYGSPRITDERFKLDEPSGVMDSPQNITIDGAPATKFFSVNAAMGDVREIWFINGGLLYEVTAPKALDDWLFGIMQSWQFIP
jgi:hypothetical protein